METETSDCLLCRAKSKQMSSRAVASQCGKKTGENRSNKQDPVWRDVAPSKAASSSGQDRLEREENAATPGNLDVGTWSGQGGRAGVGMNGRERHNGRGRTWSTSAVEGASPACGANDDSQRCSRLELCGTTLKRGGGVGAPGWSHRSQHCLPDRTGLLGGQGLVLSYCEELQVTRGGTLLPRRHSLNA